MEFDFETLVERSGANLKLMMTPPEVVKAGNISLDGAEPDFKSAPVIEEAVIRFAKNGLYGFTLPDEAYKSAVTKWMQMSRKTQIKPEWIVTTLGTIYSLATTIRLVCTDPDDGIIVTTPVYNRYRQAADRLPHRCAADAKLLAELIFRGNLLVHLVLARVQTAQKHVPCLRIQRLRACSF